MFSSLLLVAFFQKKINLSPLRRQEQRKADYTHIPRTLKCTCIGRVKKSLWYGTCLCLKGADSYSCGEKGYTVGEKWFAFSTRNTYPEKWGWNRTLWRNKHSHAQFTFHKKTSSFAIHLKLWGQPCKSWGILWDKLWNPLENKLLLTWNAPIYICAYLKWSLSREEMSS